MSDVLDSFLSAVADAFAGLKERGFVIPENGVTRSPLGGRVLYMGNNVAISLSYDIREKYCECYVGRVRSGCLVKNNVVGGYWKTLFSYLVEKHNYRRSIPDVEEAKGREFPDLYGFAEVMKNNAAELLEDSISAFDGLQTKRH